MQADLSTQYWRRLRNHESRKWKESIFCPGSQFVYWQYNKKWLSVKKHLFWRGSVKLQQRSDRASVYHTQGLYSSGRSARGRAVQRNPACECVEKCRGKAQSDDGQAGRYPDCEGKLLYLWCEKWVQCECRVCTAAWRAWLAWRSLCRAETQTGTGRYLRYGDQEVDSEISKGSRRRDLHRYECV